MQHSGRQRWNKIIKALTTPPSIGGRMSDSDDITDLEIKFGLCEKTIEGQEGSQIK